MVASTLCQIIINQLFILAIHERKLPHKREKKGRLKRSLSAKTDGKSTV
jgi:hypothetical protein